MIAFVKQTEIYKLDYNNMGKRKIDPFSNIFQFCEEFNYKLNFYSLADFLSDNGTVDYLEHF